MLRNNPHTLAARLISTPPLWLQALVWFGVVFTALAVVQFATPNLPDNDGYYHIRLAEIMRGEGWKPDFPWLPLTVLNPREYYDHHFLFHVGLIPFTFGDLRLGAKWASVFFASLAFLGVWILLRGQRLPYAGVWSLGLLAVSEAFLYRMSITRAQSLSLLILALGLHCLLTRRNAWLLSLGFLYVWAYNAFPLLPALAVLYLLGVWLAERRLAWQPVVWASLGVGLGLVINPYFPFNLIFIFRHLLPKLVEATAVSVGNEWFPYNTQQLLTNSGFALGAFLSGVLALGLRGERMDARTATSLLAAIFFGGMLFQARRFVEYFPPFALIFAAFAWSPLIQTWQKSSRDVPGSAPRRNLPAGGLTVFQNRWPGFALAGLMLFGAFRTLPAAAASIQTAKPYTLFAGASAWLRLNTPPGARIFQTDWDDFPRLFYYNTHNTYLIGLDPTYMQLYDPALYELWVRITQGEEGELARLIPARFGAHYIVSDRLHRDFLRRAGQEPGLREVYRDEETIVFAIE